MWYQENVVVVLLRYEMLERIGEKRLTFYVFYGEKSTCEASTNLFHVVRQGQLRHSQEAFWAVLVSHSDNKCACATRSVSRFQKLHTRAHILQSMLTPVCCQNAHRLAISSSQNASSNLPQQRGRFGLKLTHWKYAIKVLPHPKSQRLPKLAHASLDNTLVVYAWLWCTFVVWLKLNFHLTGTKTICCWRQKW